MRKLENTTEAVPESTAFHWLSTKQLALIAVLTALWIVSQLYVGQFIGQITQVHGVTQRMLGWFLMLTLAELTGKFGRVTMMAATASIATRILRPGRLYSISVGFGYALGGLTLDLLYFFPLRKKLGKKTWKIYLLGISALSAAVSFVPYLLYKFSVLGPYGFLGWIPFYIFSMARSIALTVVGTTIGISVMPQIDIWRSHFRQSQATDS